MLNTGSGPPEGANSDAQESSRKRAVRVYMVISVVQALSGLVVFACAGITIHYWEHKGFPYFSGSLAIGGSLLLSSMIAFRVYNKGPLYSTCERSKKEVLCAINWHRGLSFFMFFIHVFSLAVIWMYGLCVMDDTECSYENNIEINKTLAIISFSVGVIGLASCALGVALMRKFGSAFGFTITERRGILRQVGHHSDVIEDMRRQNTDVQRHLDYQYGQGFINYGFETPVLPPYSTSDMEISTVQTLNPSLRFIYGGPPKYSDLELTVLPSEAPPPYKEREDQDVVQSDSTNF